MKHNRAFYRRLLVAHLIDTGHNTVPKLLAATNMPPRTLQDTLASLESISIIHTASGSIANRQYEINSWGVINNKKIKEQLQHVKLVLI